MHYKPYKNILSAKMGINLFRGCTHGCIYCDSRSACYHIDHDFEDIEIKENAPSQLRAELRKKRKKAMIKTGAMTDPYMPFPETRTYIREALKVILDEGFGVSVQTKSHLILNDMDLLEAIHKKTKCVVEITLTTYDDTLCKIIEPNVSTTSERLKVLKVCQELGIPTIVWLSPILPFINDTQDNISRLLECCVAAGVKGIMCFGMGVTLREGNREYFYQKLDQHFPGLKEIYMKTFKNAYECVSPNHPQLMKLVASTCLAHGILYKPQEVFDYIGTFQAEPSPQLNFFNDLL